MIAGLDLFELNGQRIEAVLGGLSLTGWKQNGGARHEESHMNFLYALFLLDSPLLVRRNEMQANWTFDERGKCREVKMVMKMC